MKVIAMLSQMDDWVNDIPPSEESQRFGNTGTSKSTFNELYFLYVQGLLCTSSSLLYV